MNEANLNNKTEILSVNPVIHYLKERHKKKDRATLAALRNGLKERDCRAMGMYPFLGRFLNHSTSRYYEDAVFFTSALFASCSEPKNHIGNLGDSLSEYANKTQSKSIEKRLVSLLNADRDELLPHLRNIIRLLESQEVGVNWEKLFDDIRQWNTENRYVQTRLARSFWGSVTEENTDDLSTTTGE